jgi:hypothetical protein
MGSIRRLVASDHRVSPVVAAIHHARRDYDAADDFEYFDFNRFVEIDVNAFRKRFFSALEFFSARRRLPQNQISVL